MKTLIFFPGRIGDPFFEKEIKYICGLFDKVFVLTYEGDRKTFDAAAAQYGFHYKVVNQVDGKALLAVLGGGWRASAPVREEFKNHIKGKHKVKKLLYALFYGMFALQAKPYMEQIIQEAEGEVYIYSMWLSRPAYAAALMNLKRDPKVKAIVSRAHGFDIYKERIDIQYLPFRKFIAENLDEISFVSSHGLKYYEANWPEFNKPVKKVAFLGTDKEGEGIKAIRAKTVPVIATCSLIRDVKRYDLILDTLSRLKTEFIWYQYGEGEDIEKIKQLAEVKLKGRQYRFMGHIPNREILLRYLADDIDFLLNLSDSEGLPVSYMEAMSIGVPVIARDSGGSSEIVDDKTGRLLDATPDTEAWAKLIDAELRMRIDHPQDYLKKSRGAFDRWNTRFNSELNTKKFFTELLQSDYTKDD